MLLDKYNVPKNEYTRLPGTARESRPGRSGIFLGPNHLLQLELRGNQERARRFYYADITAIRCVVVWWAWWFEGALALATSALWAVYILSGRDAVALFWTLLMAGAAVITIVVNVLRGAVCRTWLHTANHTVRLPSLRRYNVALRAIAQIDTRIREAQGAMEQGGEGDVLPPFVPFVPEPESERKPTIRPHDAVTMTALFYLAYVNAVVTLILIFFEPQWMSALDGWLSLAIMLLGPMAILRSYVTNCPPRARRMALFVIGYSIALIPVVLLFVLILSMAGLKIFWGGRLADMSPSMGAPYFLRLFTELSVAIVYSICAWLGLKALREASNASGRAVEP